MAKVRAAMKTTTADFIIAVLVILSLAMGFVANYDNHTFASCIANYANQNSAVLVTRSTLTQRQIELTIQENSALDDLIARITNAKTHSDVANAFVIYNNQTASFKAAQAQLDQEKAAHPFPPPPKEVC